MLKQFLMQLNGYLQNCLSKGLCLILKLYICIHKIETKDENGLDLKFRKLIKTELKVWVSCYETYLGFKDIEGYSALQWAKGGVLADSWLVGAGSLGLEQVYWTSGNDARKRLLPSPPPTHPQHGTGLRQVLVLLNILISEIGLPFPKLHCKNRKG